MQRSGFLAFGVVQRSVVVATEPSNGNDNSKLSIDEMKRYLGRIVHGGIGGSLGLAVLSGERNGNCLKER